jgi:hypothetical protein
LCSRKPLLLPWYIPEKGAASPKSAVKMPTPIFKRFASFSWYHDTASGLLRSRMASSMGGLPLALRTTYPFLVDSSCSLLFGLKYGSCHRLVRKPSSLRSEIIFSGSSKRDSENSKSQRWGTSVQSVSRWMTSQGISY